MKNQKLKITLSALLISSALFGTTHAQEWNFEDTNNLAQGEVSLKNEKGENVKLTAQKSLATSNVVSNKPNPGLRSVFSPLAGLTLDTGWHTVNMSNNIASHCFNSVLKRRIEAKVLEDGTPKLRMQVVNDVYPPSNINTGWFTGLRASHSDDNNVTKSNTSCELTTNGLMCSGFSGTCTTTRDGKNGMKVTTGSTSLRLIKDWPL